MPLHTPVGDVEDQVAGWKRSADRPRLAADEQSAGANVAALEDLGASEKQIAAASARLNAAADAAQADYTTDIPRKAPEAPKNPKAPKADDGNEANADRLPTALAELKETKSGVVLCMTLTGSSSEAIASELERKFKMSTKLASKMVRRITGRCRLVGRALELVE